MLVSFGRYNISIGKLNMTTQTQELKWQSGEMGSPNLCRLHSSLIGQGIRTEAYILSNIMSEYQSTFPVCNTGLDRKDEGGCLANFPLRTLLR